MSKYSSFKSHQLITENWRKFLNEAYWEAELSTGAKKLNALWTKLRDEDALRNMTSAELAAAAGLQDDETGVIDEMWEIQGIFWSQIGQDEFEPDDPKYRDEIEAEKEARRRTGGASRGEQIGLPGFEQE
jgi:hypothetical protein